MYSPACFVKRSLSIIVLDILITVSFLLHLILDYTEKSIPVVQKYNITTCTGVRVHVDWMRHVWCLTYLTVSVTDA